MGLRPPTGARRVLPLLILALAAGCNTLDVGRPIALAPSDDWDPAERAILDDAAGCWNLQFGAQLAEGAPHDPPQIVTAQWNDLTCLDTGARTEPNLPVQISLCRRLFVATDGRLAAASLSRTLLHELGHALNVRPHASDPDAVMYGSEVSLPPHFSDQDCALFADANPALPRPLPCGAAAIVWANHAVCRAP